jgi:hypothetical protein
MYVAVNKAGKYIAQSHGICIGQGQYAGDLSILHGNGGGVYALLPYIYQPPADGEVHRGKIDNFRSSKPRYGGRK